MKQKIEIEVPDGFRVTGMDREESHPIQAGSAHDVWYRARLVPMTLHPWRAATASDVCRGDAFRVRCRNYGQEWQEIRDCEIRGYDPQFSQPWFVGGRLWQFCEVLELV